MNASNLKNAVDYLLIVKTMFILIPLSKSKTGHFFE